MPKLVSSSLGGSRVAVALNHGGIRNAATPVSSVATNTKMAMTSANEKSVCTNRRRLLLG
jgi:hypothetical protein